MIADYTKPAASGHELTTTSYADYLKNIKLNLSIDFALDDLTQEQRTNLEELRKAYGMDVSLIGTFKKMRKLNRERGGEVGPLITYLISLVQCCADCLVY